MKLLKWLLIVLVAGAALFFMLRWLVAWMSPVPENLRVENGNSGTLGAGRLAPCPDSPNCVSSYEMDIEHGMEAIEFEGETAVAQEHILAIIQAMPRSTIITNQPGYIHAEFRSPTWQFIDDAEFYFDEEANVIQFRSASRLGRGDGGVNRKRMEEIRAAYAD
jgi:uncharacterized protein (DUF1499 family)